MEERKRPRSNSVRTASDDGNDTPSLSKRPNLQDEHYTSEEAPHMAAEASANGDANKDAPQITMRALIVTQDASIIIGKAGSHIKEIRDKSGAKINVTESIPGNPERILNVTGALDAVSKAFGLIVRKINDEPFDVASVPGSRAVTIKFIIPNSRMGSVIGRSGVKIKEIQEASGAKLQASEAMLPASTERVLSISGVADAIHIAVYYVGAVLQENEGKASHNTPYRPAAPGAYPPPAYPAAGGRNPYPGYAPPPDRHYGGGHRDPYGAPDRYGGGYPPAYPPAPAPYAAAAAGGASTTQQMYIPNDMVGAMIGKGGKGINEIRTASGCTIKILEPTESGAMVGSDRVINVTGPAPGVSMAISMLYQRLETEKQRKLTSTI